MRARSFVLFAVAVVALVAAAAIGMSWLPWQRWSLVRWMRWSEAELADLPRRVAEQDGLVWTMRCGGVDERIALVRGGHEVSQLAGPPLATLRAALYREKNGVVGFQSGADDGVGEHSGSMETTAGTLGGLRGGEDRNGHLHLHCESRTATGGVRTRVLTFPALLDARWRPLLVLREEALRIEARREPRLLELRVARDPDGPLPADVPFEVEDADGRRMPADADGTLRLRVHGGLRIEAELQGEPPRLRLRVRAS